MKNLIRMGVFAIGIFVFQTTITFASDYNYLPPDVLIKQNETISSLQYQIQSLQAQVSNNPNVSVSVIDQRIAELQRQRDTEKNYVSGTLAQYGATEMLNSKLADIDAKYQSQIDALQQQKASYQSQSYSQQQRDQEITDLNDKIIELQKQSIEQQDAYQKVLDQQLEAIKNAPQPTYQATQSTDNELTESDVYTIFSYIDSLPIQQASNEFQKIKVINPPLAQIIIKMYGALYPHGKPGTSAYEDYQASLKTNAKTQIQPNKIATTTESVIVTATTSPVIATEPMIVETPKLTFAQKFIGFFKRFMFWK